ncbi:MAG: hypothetical protein ACI38Q_02080 [Candidatus Bruticola sp.]
MAEDKNKDTNTINSSKVSSICNPENIWGVWPSALLYLICALLCGSALCLNAGQEVAGYLGYENTAQTLWIYHSWESYYIETLRFFKDNYGFWGSWLHLPELYSRLTGFGEHSSVSNGLDFLWTWPLAKIFGFPLYYNIKCLLIIIANALAGRWLCRKMDCRPFVAFLGGLFFAFNPWQSFLMSTGRIIELQTFWPVLFIGSLFAAWEDNAPFKWAKCGAFLALTACNYWFYGHFAVIFACFFVIYQLASVAIKHIKERKYPVLQTAKLKVFLINSVLFLLTFSVIILPTAHPYLVRLFCHDNIPGLVRPDPNRVPDVSTLYRQAIAYSCEASYPFLSPAKGLKSPINPPQSVPTEAVYSANLSLMALLAFFLLATGAIRKNITWLKFWCCSSFVFFWLPLGPFLKLNAELIQWRGSPLAMPYKFLCDHVPLLNKLFWPSQSMLLFIISVSIFIAMSFEALLSKGRLSKYLAAAISVIVICLPFGEALQKDQLPWPSSKISERTFQTSDNAKENIDFSKNGMIFVPLGRRPWLSENDYNHNFYYDPDLTLIDLRMVIDNNRALFSRNLYNCGKDAWIFNQQTSVDHPFIGFICDLGSNYEPRSFSRADLQQIQHEGYNFIAVSERLCSHRPLGGSYTTILNQGTEIFQEICQNLEKFFGPSIKTLDEYSYEKDLKMGEIVPKTYRIKIYDTRDYKDLESLPTEGKLN